MFRADFIRCLLPRNTTSIPKIAGQWHPNTATRLCRDKNTKRLAKIGPVSGFDHYNTTETTHAPWSMNESKVKIMLVNLFTHPLKLKNTDTKNGGHLKM